MQIHKQFDLFGNLQFIGDSESKLADLYTSNPSLKKYNKTAIIEYWKAYEGLSKILGDRLYAFEQWFLNKSTSPETITRCLRNLKENGVISLSENDRQGRQEDQHLHRQYWSNHKRNKPEQKEQGNA